MKKLKREKYLEIIKAKEASMLIHIAEMDELRKENVKLRQQVKNLTMHFVSKQRELLIAFCEHLTEQGELEYTDHKKMADTFLAINCC